MRQKSVLKEGCCLKKNVLKFLFENRYQFSLLTTGGAECYVQELMYEILVKVLLNDILPEGCWKNLNRISPLARELGGKAQNLHNNIITGYRAS